MEAEPQPSACDADQITQRAASRTDASVANTASNTSSSTTSLRKRRSSVMARAASVMVATPARRASRSSAVAIVMDPILAKGRNKREGQQGRDQEPDATGQQVPVAGGGRVGQAAAAKPGRPPSHRRQPDDIEEGGGADHADGERPHVLAVTEGERTAGRTGCPELEADEERGAGEDGRRPAQVGEERPAQRLESSALRRAASAASRPVMR